MKAIDIANQNHVSADDVLIICKELGIACENGDTDIVGNDIFLVEKRIETIKNQKAKEALKKIEKRTEKSNNRSKKIKLKRKVHVSKEIIKEKGLEEVPGETEESEKPKKEASAAPAVQDTRPPAVTGEQKAPAKPSGEKKEGPQRGTDRRPESERPKGKEGSAARGARDGRGPGARGEHGRRDAGAAGAAGEAKTSGASDAPKGDVSFSGKETPGKRKKNVVKDKEKRYRKEKEKEKSQVEKDIVHRKKKPGQRREKAEAVPPKDIEITESILVGDLAKKLNVKVNEVIAKLMKLGMMATINQVIDAETAEILASEYGTVVKVVSLYDETVIKQEEINRPEDQSVRPPIVTVMGHVDHGKTKLLDAIRKTNVVDGEHGGITQHIGAYSVNVEGQKITFLDTPGHEAFTTMRARGAAITDIVILIIAADDGVMPQTVEAIDHAKAANVPIIVAINKIDLQNANVEKVKTELTKYELIPEEWGGSTLFAEVSAKQMLNIDKLLELIVLQSEVLELNANPTLMAKGRVIESKLDPGRGAVATILVQNGTLRTGDPFVVGVQSGKVRAMFNDLGEQVDEAGPSMPVEVLGISGVPNAGDPFEVVQSEKYSKQISQKRHELMRQETAKKIRKVTLEDLNDMIRDGEVKELCIIIKADVDGSVQALKEALEKISNEEIRVNVIRAGTGGINESDVMLASASNAIILGYHVRPTARVIDLADKEKVSIKYYNVIFEATSDVKAAMEGMLSPEIREEVVGTGEVKQPFKISKVGTVAGSVVLSGKIQRKNKIRLIRDGVVVFDGEMKSLKRYKDDVSEVEPGQECGIMLQGYNDIKEGDSFEAYRILEIAKTLDG
ncbi:MAG TPA: translation initiation factor IF-2 [Spirochaetota bacterium]|nr:translation initiation factor IF-2 [Spirochaetota bacterium]